MATQTCHQDQYKHNKEFLTLIDATNAISAEYDDWRIITIFYCALHIVEAVLAQKLDMHTQHNERRQLIGSRSDLFSQRVVESYEQLHSLSMKTRYYCVPLSKMDIQWAKDSLQIIENELSG